MTGRALTVLPSHDLSAVSFDHLRYWRGPVWAIMNYMAASGMAEQGLTAEGARIRADTVRLIVENGFAEYFSPSDGTPCGGRDIHLDGRRCGWPGPVRAGGRR